MNPLLTFVTSDPVIFVAVVSLFSLLVGSFLNVVIYRTPVMMENDWKQEIVDYLSDQKNIDKSAVKAIDAALERPEKPFNLATPKSRCPHCGSGITAIQNIPLLSYLLQKGKCVNCSSPISLRYPFVECITAILCGVVAWHFFSTPLVAVLAVFLTFCLVCLTGIDYDTYLLPDHITLPLVWLGLIVNYFGLFTDFQSAFWGAIAGYLALWSVFWVFKIVTGKEGMGYGDFKLLAALGAWLGWQMLPLIIILSSLVGAIIGIALIAFKNHEQSKPIPFGPYLAIAGWIALVWGGTITDQYLQFAGL